MTALLVIVELDKGPSWYQTSFVLIHAGLTAALLVRSIRRRASFVATYVLLAAMAVLMQAAPVNLGVSPLILCAPLALYKVARHDPPVWGAAGLVLGIAGSFVSPINHMPTGGNKALIPLLILGMVGTYLWASGRRRTEVAYLDQQARAHAEHIRETSRRVAQAQVDERARIAREIHDIVAHSLAVVNVQASTALAIGTEDRMRESLSGVRDASGEALAELRSLVSVLRDDSPGREVSGDLLRLRGLVAEAAGAGVDLAADLPDDETLHAWEQGWSAPARLAVVRVVQEGLSNVIKHGGPKPRAILSLRGDGDEAVVEVHNDSRRQGESSGFGLVGLRERIELAGGRFEAGADGDGFSVRARIPTTKEQA